jgi:DNA recombination protein RmuC
MFIPSDAMYNEVANDQITMDKLHRLRIVVVSPTTILSVIYAISMVKDKIAINNNAHTIQDYLLKVEKSIGKFREEYDKLGRKLREAQDVYDKSSNHVSQVEVQISKVKKLELAAHNRDLLELPKVVDTLETNEIESEYVS